MYLGIGGENTKLVEIPEDKLRKLIKKYPHAELELLATFKTHNGAVIKRGVMDMLMPERAMKPEEVKIAHDNIVAKAKESLPEEFSVPLIELVEFGFEK